MQALGKRLNIKNRLQHRDHARRGPQLGSHTGREQRYLKCALKDRFGRQRACHGLQLRRRQYLSREIYLRTLYLRQIRAYLPSLEALARGTEYDAKCTNGNVVVPLLRQAKAFRVPVSALQRQEQECGRSLIHIAAKSLTMFLVGGWRQYSGTESLIANWLAVWTVFMVL
jgi:hypothetical protein